MVQKISSPQAKLTLLDEETPYRTEALDFYRSLLTARTARDEFLVRDDYKELAETSMILLSEVPPFGYISLKIPGPTHKVRFCQHGIYAKSPWLFQPSQTWRRISLGVLRNLQPS